jgi:hypothetical protein
MALVSNSLERKVYCFPVARELAPGETVEVSDEEAAQVNPGIFHVDFGSAPAPQETAKLLLDAEQKLSDKGE